MIGAASALCLGLICPALAMPAAGDDRLSDPGAMIPAPVYTPGGAPQSTLASPEMAAFLQCKTACAPRCESLGNTSGNFLQAERCQQACELKCNGIGGK